MREPSWLQRVSMAAVLEILFLAFCLILVGHGVSEFRKGKSRLKNGLLALFGLALALLSLWMAKLFAEG